MNKYIYKVRFVTFFFIQQEKNYAIHELIFGKQQTVSTTGLETNS